MRKNFENFKWKWRRKPRKSINKKPHNLVGTEEN